MVPIGWKVHANSIRVERTEGTKRHIRQTVDVDVEVDSGAVRIRCAGHVTSDARVGSVWEDGGVGDTHGVSGHDAGVAKFAGGARHDGSDDGAVDESLGADDGEAQESGCGGDGTHV